MGEERPCFSDMSVIQWITMGTSEDIIDRPDGVRILQRRALLISAMFRSYLCQQTNDETYEHDELGQFKVSFAGEVRRLWSRNSRTEAARESSDCACTLIRELSDHETNRKMWVCNSHLFYCWIIPKSSYEEGFSREIKSLILFLSWSCWSKWLYIR